MKLDLPDDHPITQAIRDKSTGSRLFLRIAELTNQGDLNNILTLEIDSWTTCTRKEFECELTDPAVRDQQMKAILEWPIMGDDHQWR